MRRDTLTGVYSQLTGKAPRNCCFPADCEGFSLHSGGRKPQLLTKRGSLAPGGGDAWLGAGSAPCSAPGQRLQLCRSAAALITNGAAAHAAASPRCRFLCFAGSRLTDMMGNLIREHLRRRGENLTANWEVM